MTRDELIEKVARGICKAVGGDPDADWGTAGFDCFPLWIDWTDEARAAIDIVLEEAARIAAMYAEENFFIASQAILEMTNEPAMLDAHMKTSSAHTAQQIAATIRALKSGDGE